MHALEARALSYRYPSRDQLALDGLSLQVRQGQSLGLLGPNGAGKTTFLSMVCGLLAPSRGRLQLFGMPSTDAAAKRCLGFCPQELALYPKLTAAENLRLFGKLAGLSGRLLTSRIAASLAIARLQSEARTRVERFSGGMKRRLNLGLALIHDPKLLLLDEPTVGVDTQSRNALFDALEELIAAGTTVIYATHYMEEVERLCSDVCIIDHGQVIATGSTKDLVGASDRAQIFRIRFDPTHQTHTAAAAMAQRGIRTSCTEDNELELSGANLATLTAAVAELTAAGGVLAVATQRPSLEQRFLELTGEELRD